VTRSACPESGLISKHLLAGFLKCGVCGGNLFVRHRAGKGTSQLTYVCSTFHKRGLTKCANKFPVPYEAIDGAILGHFKEQFSNPTAVAKYIQQEHDAKKARPDERRAQIQALRAEVQSLDKKLASIVEAIGEGGGDVRALVRAAAETEERRDQAAASLGHLEAQADDEGEFDALKWLVGIRDILSGVLDVWTLQPTSAGRAMLRDLLASPITITPRETPEGVVFEYRGVSRLDVVLAGHIPPALEAPPRVGNDGRQSQVWP